MTIDLPTMWIKRIFQDILSDPPLSLRLFPVWLLLGPRQVGKSALLQHISDKDRQLIDLDDLAVRARANADPVLFAKSIQLPCLIDEIQYAPALLSAIKQRSDAGAAPGSIFLTGSQNFEVMHGVRESLAGRVAILNLLGFSEQEMPPESYEPAAYFRYIARSSFPKLYDVTDADAITFYLNSYVQTYIERDVRELLGIQKRREFELFVRLCALRTGQIINHADLARDASISPITAKEWLSLLEDSFLIAQVQPYFSNVSKRLIKASKLYFLDAGLAAHLAGWRNSEIMRHSPSAGALFETQIFGQIWRHFKHQNREVKIYFFRTRDGVEADFLVEHGGKIQPIEVKMGMPDARRLADLSKIREPNWSAGTVISLALAGDKPAPLSEQWLGLGPDRLAECLG